MNKDIFVLPLGWMAQFSCCWCNSACGGWLVENSWETSGIWILHWGRLLGKMLCICLCLQSTWPTCSLLPLHALSPSERGGAAAANVSMPHQYRGQSVWRPTGPASATCHITATQTWGPGLERKTQWRLLTKSIMISLWRGHRLRLIPHVRVCKKKEHILSECLKIKSLNHYFIQMFIHLLNKSVQV